jgi:hypothetical protein
LDVDEYGSPRLSSRRLLVLLEGLPDTSWFKTVAERDGDWTDAMKVAAETYAEITKATSEISKVVSVLVAANGGGEYDVAGSKFFPSPIDRRKPVEPEHEGPIYMGVIGA